MQEKGRLTREKKPVKSWRTKSLEQISRYFSHRKDLLKQPLTEPHQQVSSCCSVHSSYVDIKATTSHTKIKRNILPKQQQLRPGGITCAVRPIHERICLAVMYVSRRDSSTAAELTIAVRYFVRFSLSIQVPSLTCTAWHGIEHSRSFFLFLCSFLRSAGNQASLSRTSRVFLR